MPTALPLCPDRVAIMAMQDAQGLFRTSLLQPVVATFRRRHISSHRLLACNGQTRQRFLTSHPAFAASSMSLALIPLVSSRIVRAGTVRRYCTARDQQSLAYVDVHCHLTHAAFSGKEGEDSAVERARNAGLKHIVVNGLEPTSNRAVLTLCSRHRDVLHPALGIYPLNACVSEIDKKEFAQVKAFEPPPAFDISAEISFIESQAAAGHLIAIGEVGLDGMYGYNQRLLDKQEEVLRELCRVARRHSLPIIVHSRAAEQRVFEVLQDEGIEKADFHCYMGKKKLGIRIAAAGYYLSIPACVTRNQQLQSLCSAIPMDRILTETDAPYLAPERGVFPNEPSYVPAGVEAIALARQQPLVDVTAQIQANYETLFGKE